LRRSILLVAGGTGGHLFPALALREVLVRRGWHVPIATDPRVGAFVEGVPDADTHRIRSATLTGGNPLAVARFAAAMAQGIAESRRLTKAIRPMAVVGFGGYPTVPPLVAARLAGIPILVHEQNAVLGRANRLLLRFGATLATGFDKPKGGESAARSIHVGNPVRAAVAAEAVRPYQPSAEGERFRLLVFGGSQGARVFSELLPAALAELPDDLRTRLRVVQQARPEDLTRTLEAFRRLGAQVELQPFFGDMAERIAAAHLVISRAGASTVSELAAIGRPAILVPYPHALDHDQAENARALAGAGGAWVVPERELTPAALAGRLSTLMKDPDRLRTAAEAARSTGRLDAAERLADLVEGIAGRAGTGVEQG
jgi:UDP-N-acetylglucosamine--N-acetylmuramyl-(pentapeptide) pyrophosphoryl-undecaprenol N-acetylglucosamine transferase